MLSERGSCIGARFVPTLFARGHVTRWPARGRRAVSCLASTQSITLVRPDDWHLHVRDGPALQAVVPLSAQHFQRAVIMPNLQPPVVTTDQVTSGSCAASHYVCCGQHKSLRKVCGFGTASKFVVWKSKTRL